MATETEVKFYIEHPDALQKRIESIGATLSEPRVLETNLRFDTPDRDLRQLGYVLRLRQDKRARMTFKDGEQAQGGAFNRRELEFTVSDFDAAKELLQALGYEVSFTYEKYRTTYKLDGAEIMLDEMPYGNFVEIEGPEDAIRAAAEKLQLKWDTAIQDSYSLLFEKLRAHQGWHMSNLSFANFKQLPVTPELLGVTPADV